MEKNKGPNLAQDVLGVVLGGFCALMLVLIPWQIDYDVPYPFYKGPVLMPLIALSMGALACLPSLFRLLFRRSGGTWSIDGGGISMKPVFMLMGAIMYPMLIWAAGLEFATIITLLWLLWFAGVRNKAVLVTIPLVLACIFYVVFRVLLDVYFPEPFILYLGQ